MTEPYVQTFSARRFRCAGFPEDVDIEDIAHALSQLNRFNGHTVRPYSVAEHSVRVARLARKLFTDREWSKRALGVIHSPDWTRADEISKFGLLHDASEYVLADLATPWKDLPELAAYRVVEKRIQDMIQAKYGLDPGLPQEVKDADAIMCNTEAEQLLIGGRKWPEDGWPPHEPLKEEQGFGWTPYEAKRQFLTTFRILWGLR